MFKTWKSRGDLHARNQGWNFCCCRFCLPNIGFVLNCNLDNIAGHLLDDADVLVPWKSFILEKNSVTCKLFSWHTTNKYILSSSFKLQNKQWIKQILFSLVPHFPSTGDPRLQASIVTKTCFLLRIKTEGPQGNQNNEKGNAQLGICWMHHLFFCVFLWLGIFQICSAFCRYLTASGIGTVGPNWSVKKNTKFSEKSISDKSCPEQHPANLLGWSPRCRRATTLSVWLLVLEISFARFLHWRRSNLQHLDVLLVETSCQESEFRFKKIDALNWLQMKIPPVRFTLLVGRSNW